MARSALRIARRRRVARESHVTSRRVTGSEPHSRTNGSEPWGLWVRIGSAPVVSGVVRSPPRENKAPKQSKWIASPRAQKSGTLPPLELPSNNQIGSGDR